MSFAVYPQSDACRAWMPTTPLPPSMSPPSPPMVCHMPAGHDGPHSNERRPTALSRRWEGDARPPAARPAGGAPDDEITEQVAGVLAEHFVRVFEPTGTGRTAVRCGCNLWRGSNWIHIDDAAREHRQHIAAAVFALPAVRAARDAQQAVQRVRDVAHDLDVEAAARIGVATGSYDDGVRRAKYDASTRIDRALDGTTS